MAKGRTLTKSEKSAVEVIQRLQALNALPIKCWDYVEVGSIATRKSTARKERIGGNDSRVLIRTRKVTFKWLSYLGVEAEVLLEQRSGVESPVSKDVCPWVAIGLEIKGKPYSQNRPHLHNIEKACVSVSGWASIAAFVNLGNRDESGTF